MENEDKPWCPSIPLECQTQIEYKWVYNLSRPQTDTEEQTKSRRATSLCPNEDLNHRLTSSRVQAIPL
jgi:hypothetical protein